MLVSTYLAKVRLDSELYRCGCVALVLLTRAQALSAGKRNAGFPFRRFTLAAYQGFEQPRRVR